DLTGSERESPTSYNSPFEGGTQVAAYYIVRTILLDDAIYPVYVPQNEGIFRPIKVVAPLGTIYNPSFPRACSGRFMKCERICDNVVLALSEPLPPGRWRGGIGIVRETRFLALGYVSSEADRHYEPPRGVYGGSAGIVAGMARDRAGEPPEPLPALLTGVEFAPGDVLRIVTPS